MFYLSGFRNHHSTEALSGVLPIGQNSPQRCPFGLYAEQISGSSFTAGQGHNLRSWLYRIRPSVAHRADGKRVEVTNWVSQADDSNTCIAFDPLRWCPLADAAGHWVQSVRTLTIAGGATSQTGMSASIATLHPEQQPVFQNHDAEMLVMPISAAMTLRTEFGILEVEVGHLAVVPRSVFVEFIGDQTTQLYLLENYGIPFELPHRGVIGANGLANERDFEYPVANYIKQPKDTWVMEKREGEFRGFTLDHSPFDVVGWHGNHAPYRYDLRRFNTLGSISYDHPDPSIFTVLSSPSQRAGVANVDVVVFGNRWLVADNTFRPPWYHRNVMSEFMGLIYGVYDAKPNGFLPGGASLHNAGVSHGPDYEAYFKASTSALAPSKLEGTLAFMFETSAPQRMTTFAANTPERQKDYVECWKAILPANLPDSHRD
ncbi:Homogentisate 1,2-dioxygenase [Marinomonas spartinae]|uniref:Homogentisate 1,2-dioxygenase n=1 Tax=Marinomonas spartinae TaxID=1792290 RepID=A0A1A8THU6_9GAMM|nr:homogentisate 1,2-dioxygenase [Marinomonas spartinae]SBS31682.1 Homogentisate 1,2-dioxygenase [Marinomonas spartinae]SBS33887.1 Homogentisate 1,2-dioxygenase [Marinomonas spartinae]